MGNSDKHLVGGLYIWLNPLPQEIVAAQNSFLNCFPVSAINKF